MNELTVLDISSKAILTILHVSAIPLLVALFVGVFISLIQTLTHIQEMTLAFIPKIVAVFFSILITLPFMGRLLNDLWLNMLDYIIALG